MEKYFSEVITPLTEGDGGKLEYKETYGGKVYVTARGECSKCNILDRCVKWAEQKIKADLNMDVSIVCIRKKPFFWDR